MTYDGAYCCFIPCDAGADYEIIDGRTPDDYTHACVEHVGHLLRDDRESTVIRISND